MQTSKLSRRIAALEIELGVRLINRTTRRLSLTEAGKTFHRAHRALLRARRRAATPPLRRPTTPNSLVGTINHERMPVLLTHEEEFDIWLRGSAEDAFALAGE